MPELFVTLSFCLYVFPLNGGKQSACTLLADVQCVYLYALFAVLCAHILHEATLLIAHFDINNILVLFVCSPSYDFT